MNTLTKFVGIGSIAATMMSPAMSKAEVDQTAAAKSTTGHSLVHRVSHSLASAKSYNSSATAGYKWGRKAEQPNTDEQWAESAPARGGYKWGNSNATGTSAQSYADSSYQWGTMSFSEQSAYKWGIRNFSEQTAYKWGIRNFSNQSAYKWGIRNFSEQTAYKWGIRSFSDQTAYKWGIR